MTDFDNIFTKGIYLKDKKGGLYRHWGELHRDGCGISAPVFYTNKVGDDKTKPHSKTNRPTFLYADVSHVGALDKWQWSQKSKKSDAPLGNILSLKEKAGDGDRLLSKIDFDGPIFKPKSATHPIHMDYSQTYLCWRIQSGVADDKETLTKFKGVIQTDNLDWKFPFSTLGNGEVAVVIKMNAKPAGPGEYGVFTADGYAAGDTSKHEYIKNTKWIDEDDASGNGIKFDIFEGKHYMEAPAYQSINDADVIFQHENKDLVVGDYILITYSVVNYQISGTHYDINGLWKVVDLGGAGSKWKLVRAHEEWDWNYAMFKCTNTFEGVNYRTKNENQQYIELKGMAATLEYTTAGANYNDIIANKISDIAGEAISDDNFSSKYKNSSGQLYKISVVPFEDYADNTSELRLVINNTLIYSGTDAEMKEVEEPVNSGLYRKQMEKIFFSTQRDIIIDGEFVSGINDLTMDFKLELLSVLNQ